MERPEVDDGTVLSLVAMSMSSKSSTTAPRPQEIRGEPDVALAHSDRGRSGRGDDSAPSTRGRPGTGSGPGLRSAPERPRDPLRRKRPRRMVSGARTPAGRSGPRPRSAP